MARMRKTVVSRAAVHGGPGVYGAWRAGVFTVQGTQLGEQPGLEILPEPYSRSLVSTQRVHLSGGKEGFATWHKHTACQHLGDIADILVAP